MKGADCPFESEVLSAVLECRWPDRVDAPLRGHAAACPICSDVITVAGAIEDAREDMRSCAVVPDAGRVWWLAQLRARREAAEAAGRPITAAQVIALACAMGLLGACFGAASQWFQVSLARVASGLAGLNFRAWFPFAISLLAQHGALVLAMAAVILLIPAAVYLTVLRD